MVGSISARSRVLHDTCRAVLAIEGEASATSLATQIVRRVAALDPTELLDFFAFLTEELAPDPGEIRQVVADVGEHAGPAEAHRLHLVTAGRRATLFEALNVAPGATAAIIDLRARLLAASTEHPEFDPLLGDLSATLRSWFNRGFLHLEQIGWRTPASVLEELIAYEAVHEIASWSDLRRRLDDDRRCFGFFHPALPGEPVIFVQVALTSEVPAAIHDVLDAPPPDPGELDTAPTTATFYSISNCQVGLRGISFGSFLLKRVTEALQAELPSLERFVTLSPLPGLREWLETARPALDPDDRIAVLVAAAEYLTAARRDREPLDPVARFHLRNGARIERLNWRADVSEQGMAQSLGVMVNYRYDQDALAANHEAYVNDGTIAMSPAIAALLA